MWVAATEELVSMGCLDLHCRYVSCDAGGSNLEVDISSVFGLHDR